MTDEAPYRIGQDQADSHDCGIEKAWSSPQDIQTSCAGILPAAAIAASLRHLNRSVVDGQESAEYAAARTQQRAALRMTAQPQGMERNTMKGTRLITIACFIGGMALAPHFSIAGNTLSGNGLASVSPLMSADGRAR